MSCFQSNFLDSEIETESKWYLPGAKERYFCPLAFVFIRDQSGGNHTVQETQGSQYDFVWEPLIGGQGLAGMAGDKR